MKGKRVVHNQHLHPAPSLRPAAHHHPSKRKIQQIKSLELKPKTHQHAPHLTKIIKMPQQQPVNDYQWSRRQRQTLNYVPIQQSPTQSSPTIDQPRFRSQRNSHSRQLFHRQNHHLLNSSNPHSINNSNTSQPRIKIFSTQNKDKSLSRSENSSVKKRGIGVTKTLLKRISGMYNAKDFQGKSSYIKSNRESTGIMTNNLTGKVNQQYQLNDSDFHIINNNRTFNISASNPLSFNDSGYHNESYSRQIININGNVNQRESWNGPANNSGIYNNRQSNQSSTYNQTQHSGTYGQNKVSGTVASRESWLKNRQSGMSYESNNAANWSKNRNSGYWSKEGADSGTWGKRSSKIIPQNQQRISKDRQPMLMTSKTPRKELVPVRSYDLLTTERPISQSIEIDSDPPALVKSRHSHNFQSAEDSRYVIKSKKCTLDQMSVKQSMVIGFDNYYQ